MSKTLNIPANINLSNGEVQNAKLQSLTTTPGDVAEARFWYDSVNHKPLYYDGTTTKEFGKNYTQGTGITISGDTISVTDYNDIVKLDSSGKVPTSQLPSFVDDVIELLTISETAPTSCAKDDKYFNTTSLKIFTATATDTWGTTGEDPEKDKIYVALDTNYSYRWSGNTMINIANPVTAATENIAGIAEIATNSEMFYATDDTRIVTPKKLAYYMSNIYSGNILAYRKKNPYLTASNGGVTWTITGVDNSNELMSVTIIKMSTNEVIYAPWYINSSGYVVVEMLSSSNIAANSYMAEIIISLQIYAG